MNFDLKAMGDACTVNDRLAEQSEGTPVEITAQMIRQSGHAIEAENLDDVADQRGLRLALAANGRYDELKKLHDSGPDFVRLDTSEQVIKGLGQMSFLDGFAACARLFLMANEGTLPIIHVYSIDDKPSVKATFDGPGGLNDAQTFIEQNPTREWALDVSDDQCPVCAATFSREAWWRENEQTDVWRCPVCNVPDPREGEHA